MNKSTAISLFVGFVVGVALLGVVGWNAMPGMMLQEVQSPYEVDETIARIKQNALDAGWVVPSVKPLHKSIAKHGGGEVLPVWLINLCQANHAANILKVDGDRKLSVMMPCTITVFKKADGKTYIGYMNAGLLGAMFGGNVADVMETVSAQQQSFIAFAF